MMRVTVLTGAGMSADSGLATFRDSGGLWEGYDIMDVASPQGWNADPEMVLDFYNKRRKQAFSAQPNDGHKAIAEMEEHFDVVVITQNVDDLHERAGSSNVIHLHGMLREARSSKNPDLVTDIGDKEIKPGDKAEDGSQLRPNVVWFGEPVPMIEKAASEIPDTDIFIVVGTSLVVYPAAGLTDYAPHGIPKFIIDPSTPEIHGYSEWTHIKEPAETGVLKLKEKLENKFLNE